MELSAHLDGLTAATDAFTTYAGQAGLDATSPTAPEWTVRQLVAHQGMVHRWATGAIHGEMADADGFEREGLDTTDAIGWLREGVANLKQAIEEAPDDLDALVFLNDAPPAKAFWARRQCHETTIHAVDALAAAKGRFPRAVDTWIDQQVALDGIDELLTGFVTRERSRLRSATPTTVVVRPDDAEQRWLVHISDQPPVTERTDGDGDIVLTGSAVALYLAVWNRTDEVATDDLWRQGARVVWG